MQLSHRLLLATLAAALVVSGCASPPTTRTGHAATTAATTSSAAPRNGSAGLDVPGVRPEMLQAQYWLARSPEADALRLDAGQVQALGERQYREDPSLNDLARLPATFSGRDVRRMIEALSKRPTARWIDAQGQPVSSTTIDGWMRALATDTIPASITPRWALVSTRADMRSFPTPERVYRDDTGRRERIDRLQETGLFVGTPVALLHTSRDGAWAFAIAPNYRAWLRLDHLALTDRATALGYRQAANARVIAPTLKVAGEQLDMGARIPFEGGRTRLPARDANGALRWVEAAVPADAVVQDALPYRPRELLTQAFKFLGEPYGWGHADGTRDCSGFVSDSYRSVGIDLARNTGDQRDSPVLQTRRFDANTPREAKLAALKAAHPGDLLFIQGHVMMVVGHQDGLIWIIHDTPGMSMREGDIVKRYPLDGVSVTPFETLRLGKDRDYVDALLAVQHVVPKR